MDYDAVVVGTGPGGAAVSRELARKNRRVLMLEWGSHAPVNGTLSQFALRAGLPGRSLLFTDKTLLGMVRGICTGGSSVFYCASAFEPPHGMMKAYGIDIENEVAEIKTDVPVAPLDDRLIGPGARRMMESAQDLGYDWKKYNKFIYQDKCRPDCPRCTYGCPHGAKWTARNFVDEAVENGATLINGARVTRVLFENRRAVGVEYKRAFQRHRVFADNVVIAAGGIGSPVILRQSGIEGAGYDFFLDPLIMAFGTVDGLNSRGETQMAAGVHMEDDGYLMVDLNFPAPVMFAQSSMKCRPLRAFNQPDTLMLMVKIKDGLGGRITHRGGVRKSLSQGDRHRLNSGYQRAKAILENAGARHVYRGWNVAAHPGGTVKIGELVDADLKTEYDNLYVCDCSVIPAAWGLPPTLTLLGLGKRLAGHLAPG